MRCPLTFRILTFLKGVFDLTRVFIPLLLKGGDKTIINVSSIGAHVVFPGASDYQPAKLALCRFAEFVSVEYADQGLLDYSIHPGGGESIILSVLYPNGTDILG